MKKLFSTRRSVPLASPTTPVVLVLHALSAAPPDALAQEVTVLTEDLCETCSIEAIPDVVLGNDGESVIAIALDIQRLSDGRFVMAFDYPVPHEFTVFSADGAEFRRVAGRARDLANTHMCGSCASTTTSCMCSTEEEGA